MQPLLHSMLLTPSVMRWTVYALLPAVLAHGIFWGYTWCLRAFGALTFGIALEAAVVWLIHGRQRAIQSVTDGSAVITVLLLLLSLPPNLPLYALSIAIASALILAKQLYGGLGFNLFNPAMVGYVVVLVSFPGLFVYWPQPTFADALTGATVLDDITWQSGWDIASIYENLHAAGWFAYWWWVLGSYVLGGCWLLWKRLIRLSVVLTFLGSASLMMGILNAFNVLLIPINLQLLSGSLVFAAFFIITDPVTSPSNRRAELILAVFAGTTSILFRAFSIYPDGIAFAILLANFLTPTLDRWIKPRTYGHN